MNTNKKILIVDDDVISNRVISYFLQDANYAIETVTNGKEAWQLLSQYPEDYQLALIDRMMFGMDGMELLRRIKEDAKLQTLPVIMLTGEAEPEEQQAALAAGALEFIYKPVEKNSFLKLIHNIFFK